MFKHSCLFNLNQAGILLLYLIYFWDLNLKKDIMKKYKCKICGHIYDPEAGDPQGGIAPGTSFDEIQDDWKCPICGVTKKDFEPI